MSILWLIIPFVISAINQPYATAEAPTKPNYFDSLCRSSFGNYTTNSPYASNLQSVLSDLVNHRPRHTFHNSSAGSGGPDAVYGQYFCRGDVDFHLCGECVKQAVDTISQNCTLFKSAIVWYEECTLRYSNQSMFGIEAEYPRGWEWSTNNFSDPTTLVSVLNETMDRLINESIHDHGRGRRRLFATGEGALLGSQRLYGLVQCSPDLNASACEGCLRDAYAFIPKRSEFVLVFFASCNLRYSTQAAFYAVPAGAPAFAPIAALSPAKAPTSSPIAGPAASPL